MADTAIPLTTLTPGASTARPAGTAIVAADNHVITLPRDVTPEEVVVRIVNTTASEKVATVTAGDAPPSGGGENVATTATLAAGNASLQEALVRLDSGHLQSDGTVVITVASAMTGTIAALHVKRA